jgi:uncharacterized protein (DUF983 family)
MRCERDIVVEISYGTAASRALKLRCPRCGRGPLFKNFITMYDRCPECSLKYERAPGYFLGSTYVNYGFMAITTTSMYMALHYGAEISNETLTIPLLVYCIAMPIILFRYARSWWLAMDCYCDPTGFGLHSVSESDAKAPEPKP